MFWRHWISLLLKITFSSTSTEQPRGATCRPSPGLRWSMIAYRSQDTHDDDVKSFECDKMSMMRWQWYSVTYSTKWGVEKHTWDWRHQRSDEACQIAYTVVYWNLSRETLWRSRLGNSSPSFYSTWNKHVTWILTNWLYHAAPEKTKDYVYK